MSDEQSWLRRIPVAEIISVLIAVGSLFVAIDARQRSFGREWEQDRPLASVHLEVELVELDSEHRYASYDLNLVNQGGLTFAIRDIVIENGESAGLSARWSEASLVEEDAPGMPLGLRAFALESVSERRVRYHFGKDRAIWHVVDPGREVSIPFLIPVDGSGVLESKVTVYLQQVSLPKVEDLMTEPAEVAGITRPAVPESGVDYDGAPLSQAPVFPYSAAGLLLVGAVPGTASPSVSIPASDDRETAAEGDTSS